jgi:predicted HicB family RNase H-like nuclease
MESRTMGQDVTKYTYRVRWSEEDGEYLATVAEFPSLSWLDGDQVGAFTGIVSLVRDVVEDMVAESEEVPLPLSMREYSGNVRLRMPPAQHRELAIRAAEEGVSLNRLLCSLISRPAIIAVSNSEGDTKGDKDTGEVLTTHTRPTKSLTISTNASYEKKRAETSCF